MAENNFAFTHFTAGEVFGETDVLCDINRNGTAVAIEHSVLYTINRDDFMNSIYNYPEDHQRLVKNAIQKNRGYVNRRYQILKKNPIYGQSKKNVQAMLSLKLLSETLTKKQKIEEVRTLR